MRSITDSYHSGFRRLKQEPENRDSLSLRPWWLKLAEWRKPDTLHYSPQLILRQDASGT
jgi:hypothetical protein